ncbi:Uncharacterised protein [Mycobacteroides abscessus subsp. abscessus]|nr:Uncharacterised protein [Mycobacteroides abscessus subsp. abscessus]
MPTRPVDQGCCAAHSTAKAPAAPISAPNMWLSPVEQPVPGTFSPTTA